MKNTIFAIATMIMAASTHNAFAVNTKDCPDSFWITYESIDPVSKKDDRVDLIKYKHIIFKLVETTSGQCRYLRDGEKEQTGDNEARLMTKAGRDILRISLKAGRDNVWIYHSVEALSVDTIDVKEVRGSKVLADFDHGSPQNTIAWAKLDKVRVL